MPEPELVVSAPGRMCLFGEHQDYFGLAIVAAAVNLRITISGRRRPDRRIRIELPDIGQREDMDLERPIAYDKKRDYLKSAVNVLRRQGVVLDSGWDCLVRGTIPINAGAASSSALCVAWVKFLLEAAGDSRAVEPDSVAELAFLTEVAEFREPGGKMDHYSSARGQVVSIHFGEEFKLRALPNPLGPFVLANSLEKKDTTGMLGFIKGNVLEASESVRRAVPGFSLHSPLDDGVEKAIRALPSPDQGRLLEGTLLTRDLAAEGEALFGQNPFDHARFGQLLSAQHNVLRDYLQTSTPKIERMIRAALEAGALGAKINGSGGGGTMFAYAPRETERVARAVAGQGGRTDIVHTDDGIRRERWAPSAKEER
jgi:galactokinase